MIAPRPTSSAGAASPVAPLREDDPQVIASMQRCRDIARTHARNFYYGMRLTPPAQRGAMYAIYAFMRACDDLADEPVQTDPQAGYATQQRVLEVRQQRIEAFARYVDRAYDQGDPHDAPPSAADIWPAFVFTIHRYPVRRADLHDMLAGQRQDLHQDRYDTFDQLYDYCYKVASTVGLVCISIWGYDQSDQARTLAEKRGIALQLTNILRDLREDARRGRCYLPKQDLDQFGIEPRDLVGPNIPERFDELMAYELGRARDYYQQAAGLEHHVDPACRVTCFTIMHVYRMLFDQIQADPRAVLRQRVSASTCQKLWCLVRARSLTRKHLKQTASTTASATSSGSAGSAGAAGSADSAASV